MIEKLLQAMVDFLTRGPLTARKLAVVLVVAVAGGLGVVAYEIETANFAPDKYAKAGAILKDLEASSTATNEGIASASDLIADRVG